MIDWWLAAAVSQAAAPQAVVLAYDVKTQIAGHTWHVRPKVQAASGQEGLVTMGAGQAGAQTVSLKATPVYDAASRTVQLTLDVAIDDNGHHVAQHLDARVAEGAPLTLRLEADGGQEMVTVTLTASLANQRAPLDR